MQRAGLTSFDFAEDPTLLNYNSLWEQCKNKVINPLDDTNPITLTQCETFFTEAENMYCGLQAYNVNKCNYVSMLNEAVRTYAGTLSSMIN
jgi:hypothetical protein